MRSPHSQITWIRANNLRVQGCVPSVFAPRLQILKELHPAPLHPQGLRKVLFGDASRVFSHDWAQAHFRFREPHSDLAYALEADKGGTRAILMAVQGNIIKYLLFVRNTEYTHLERLCKISQKEQGEALAAALADSLWAAGEGQEAIVCLTSAASHFVPTADYKADNFTERIQLFNFFEKAAAQKFIFDHINCFKSEGSKGLILFLYSLLFSRTLERVQKDLGGTTAHLLEFSCGNVICTQPLLQVVLAGSACPSHRCEVGFLRWSRGEAGHRLSLVGSVLKTPKFPIWLCSINGMHSVLFSTNRLLLSDWKMEHVFHLYFYNGQRGQTRTAHLTVDTHSHHWEEGRCADTSSPGKRSPSLEMAIRTRWPGAAVSWNGTDPFY
ncbi:inactive ubiquitin carboxyl-terminal hydrolase MINDY-4B isoform X1 [Cygnus olor]|uniref:inactive ubiquitin carboxyl-terminal hydrolase MINDY-4B isoform X1 n=2 Tax=Cygnus olor TaxID=8869 RepID=UPI001ADE434B|nr:inactive ubiquitin carboxyl-terminal hydrolase MINDY-4B isoform X1 [Cygnus olor]XP_040423229.1 inactive ubiquitin carboxyl-terminal hydrolase MINDY-4B isoform X1 [Cygnus olor]XP_040423230.1 inactive ubiquitin carboxyl-terminal hydrolase MINDY-4B isoform X1 [Cygnus olor]